MSATRFYFCSWDDHEDGENYDLVVEAHSVAEAIELWRENWRALGPRIARAEPPSVFLLPHLTGEARVLPWWAEDGLKSVTP
jgi:hypothetical protein